MGSASLSLIEIVLSDAACTTLSTAGIPLELHSGAACGTQMPLAEALYAEKPSDQTLRLRAGMSGAEVPAMAGSAAPGRPEVLKCLCLCLKCGLS